MATQTNQLPRFMAIPANDSKRKVSREASITGSASIEYQNENQHESN